jgi:hypothetical protein
LSLTKEKSYPPLEKGEAPSTGPLAEYTIRTPGPEEIKTFVRLVNEYYNSRYFPPDFIFPGKIVDMVNAGDSGAALAIGLPGRIGGGIFWRWTGIKTVECFGPYLFNQGSDSTMSEDLLEACIGNIAKTHAVCLISRFPTDDFPRDHFELLGSLTFHDRDGSSFEFNARFRQMQEDPGCSVWSHPDLEDFLRREYKRLFLPREIMTVRDQGESKEPFSVLSAEFNRSERYVTLRPVRHGADIEENLRNHLRLFKEESLTAVFFEIDLAFPSQAGFTPFLLNNGFIPRKILPYAGEGDLVTFQLGVELS